MVKVNGSQDYIVSRVHPPVQSNQKFIKLSTFIIVHVFSLSLIASLGVYLYLKEKQELIAMIASDRQLVQTEIENLQTQLDRADDTHQALVLRLARLDRTVDNFNQSMRRKARDLESDLKTRVQAIQYKKDLNRLNKQLKQSEAVNLKQSNKLIIISKDIKRLNDLSQLELRDFYLPRPPGNS